MGDQSRTGTFVDGFGETRVSWKPGAIPTSAWACRVQPKSPAPLHGHARVVAVLDETSRPRKRGHGTRQAASGTRWCAIVGLLVIVAPLAGCVGLPAPAREQMLTAERAYRNGQYATACRSLDDVLGKYPHRPESAEAYYLRGLALVKQSKKRQATDDVRHCIRLSQDRNLTAKAQAMAGALSFESGDTRTAIRHYEKALKHLPEQPPTDRVRYRYGLCLQRNGQWKDARAQFAKVLQCYPRSKCGAEARKLYDWPSNTFSIQCGAFRDKSAAAELKRKLDRVGLDARVEARPRSGELLHFVYVGRYSRHDQAMHAIGGVKRQVKDALIVP